MANRIEFSTYVDESGFINGIREMEAAAQAASMRMQNSLSSIRNGKTGQVFNETKIQLEKEEYAQFWKMQLDSQDKFAKQKSLYNTIALNQIAKEEQAAAKAAKDLATQKSLFNTIALNQIAKEEAAAKAAATAANLQTLMLGARGYGPAGPMTGGAHSFSLTGVIRESMVIIRELAMGRGLGRVAGSVTLLAQYMGGLKKVVTSTATSFIEAAEAQGKLYQQMAMAALQARGTAQFEALETAALNQKTIATKAAEEAEIALAGAQVKVRWGLVGMIAGLAAAAFAAFLLYRHFQKLAEEKKNFADLTNASKKQFTDEAKAMEEDAKAHEDFNRWMREELSNRNDLEDVTERRLKQLRAEADAQRELARAKGASAEQINALDVAQLKREKDLLEAAKSRADVDFQNAQQKAQFENSRFTNNPSKDGVDLRGAQKAMESSGAIVDAVQAYIKEHPEVAMASGSGSVVGGLSPIQGVAAASRPRTDADVNEIEVNGKKMVVSMKEAMDAYNKNKSYVDDLTRIQGELRDNLESSKGDVKAAKAALKKYNDQLDEVNRALGIKSTSGAQVAALEDAKKSAGKFGGGDSLVRVGNFLGTAKSGIDNTMAEMVRLQRQSVHHLGNIDRKMNQGGTHFSPV